jgi:hypothetical protein
MDKRQPIISPQRCSELIDEFVSASFHMEDGEEGFENFLRSPDTVDKAEKAIQWLAFLGMLMHSMGFKDLGAYIKETLLASIGVMCAVSETDAETILKSTSKNMQKRGVN